ncbi:27 kDa glycoprotein-like [Anopheles aquasalis]|uniref:27 kDa glycoprotein-like n=1 Tax=Anopheles aquasalis TaxID=42839 RepID=UPI00215AE28E|nr:27 kDa glycoprotein-like [Anopheles aquasalis]
MSKWSVILLFIGLFVVSDGSPLSHESSDSDEVDTTGHSTFTINLIKKCKKNTGSNAAFWAVMESAEKTSICLSEFNIKAHSFKTDFDHMTNATRTAFFKKYCSEGRLLFSCFDDVQAHLRPCLGERDLKILNVTQTVFPETLDYVCKNDGEIIYKLKDQTRYECFTQKFDQVFECARNGETGVFYGWDIFELTQDQCSILMAFRECLKNTMDTCDLSDVVSLYDMIVNPILRLSLCANSTEKPKDETHQENSTDEVLNRE